MTNLFKYDRDDPQNSSFLNEDTMKTMNELNRNSIVTSDRHKVVSERL